MFAIINALKAAAQTPAVQGRLSERGATMVEYGIGALGLDVFGAFNNAEDNMPAPGGPLAP
jgi:hypothetical protein